MEQLFLLSRGIAIGALVSLAGYLWLRLRVHYAARLLTLVMLGITAYLVAPLTWPDHPVALALVVAVADTVPLLFLLFVQGLFLDHRKPATPSLLLGLGYYLPGYLGFLVRQFGKVGDDPLIMALLYFLPQGIKGFTLLYALWCVVSQWRNDLVELRRIMRLLLVLVVGCNMVAVVAVEVAYAGASVPPGLEAAHSLGIAVLSLAAALFLVQADAADFFGPADPLAAARSAPHPDSANPSVLKLRTAMEQDRLYRDMQLTIGRLAAHLGLQEHQLRRLINGELGFRNFNDFLNRYRIAEAAARLRDPDEAHLPVLTIAMDAGYQSMTTFNKVFKASRGMTPTEFRKSLK